MSSHLSTAIMLLPPQIMTDTPFGVQLFAASDGTGITITGDTEVLTQTAGQYSDAGVHGNDTILDLVVPASGIVSGTFTKTINGDSSPDPLNVPETLFLLTSDGYQVPPSNQGQAITVVSPVNVGSLPSIPPGTPIAVELTLPANSAVVVQFLPSSPGTGSAFSPIPLPPDTTAGTGSAAILGYLATCMQNGLQSALTSVTLVLPPFGLWGNNPSDSSLLIDATVVALPVASPPSVANTVTAINSAAVPGVRAYAVGTSGTEQIVLVSTNSTLTLTNNAGTANALTVLGYAGTPASVVGGVASVATPAHGTWTAITTSAYILVNGTRVSLGTSTTPSAATVASNINTAAPPGVLAYLAGATTAEVVVLQGFVAAGNPNGAVVVADGGGVTNGLTVLGAAANLVGLANAVVTGLSTAVPYQFAINAVSPLGNSAWSAPTASAALS